MPARWRIRLLGELRAELEGTSIARFRTQKVAALLARLALQAGRPEPREVLIELFWPDVEPRAGRGSLNQAVSSLRRQLEPPGMPRGSVVLADRATVALDPRGIATDVAEFEAALAAGAAAADPAEEAWRLAEAVERYTGDLLPGFYDDWILIRREQLRSRFLDAAHRLAGLLSASGEVDRALAVARRAAVAEPLDERAARDLMGLEAAAGRPDAALRIYRDLERALERELGSAPSAATHALAARIGGGPSPAGPVCPGAPSPPARTPAPISPAPPASPKIAAGDEPAATAAPRRASLPPQPTRLFGREVELERIRTELSGGAVRLITITGPPGAGKTRLAIEAAERLDRVPGNAIRFVPLADLADERLLAEAILARIGGAPAPSGDDTTDRLAEVLAAGGPTLLVLDNLEHLVEEAAALVGRLLERVPVLRCLATSRRPLGIAAERELPLGPLPVPRGAEPRERLAAFPSVQLFVDRARAAVPDFQLTERNASALAEVCRRLEGIPLAIELAASQAKVLGPARILERLDRPFELLVSRRRDPPTRHRTLRAALDWSVHLLGAEPRRFFARLAVFRGPFGLEAAEAVLREPGEPPALERIEGLREASLLLAESDAAEVRFRMLEVLREYAAELVPAEELERLRRRHAEHYLGFAEAAVARRGGLDLLEAEHENLRAALDWLSAAPERAEAGLRLAVALAELWILRGHLAEGRRRFADLLPRAPARTALRANALSQAAKLAWTQGDVAAARRLVEEAVAIRRMLADHAGAAAALNTLGIVLFGAGEYRDARRALGRAAQILRARGDRLKLASAVSNLALIEKEEGRLASARRLLEEARATFEAHGYAARTANALLSLGDIASREGDLARARTLHEQSLALYREAGDRRGTAAALHNLAAVAEAAGDGAAARALYEEALAIFREIGERRGIGAALKGLGDVALAAGDRTAARRLYAEAVARLREAGDRPWLIACLDGLAALGAADGDFLLAARLLGAAEAQRRALNSRFTLAERRARAATAAATRRALGPERFRSAVAAGRRLSIEAAVADAIASLSA